MQEYESFSKNIWKKLNIYKTEINNKEKEIILDFFPYPSGEGLHIGHILGYTATDIYSRFKRANNKNVLYAMGFDSFGLPAEQFAIEKKIHPSIITNENIKKIKEAMELMGYSYDLSREFSTTDSSYYKWTQWIFIQIFNSYYDEEENKAKHINYLEEKLKKQNLNKNEIKKIINENRLAYIDEIEVNWCPKLGTVLADEEIINGLSERGNFPVVKKKLKQWMMRITKYSERLVNNLNLLDWPEPIKEMQKNWINLSYGHIISFKLENLTTLEIYTTRVETINAVAFIAISKNHELAKDYKIEEEKFEGIKTQHNVIYNDKLIPIYIADYVLDYATKAVMGVPAHDERDFEFAKKNKIQFNPIIIPTNNFLNKINSNEEEYFKNPTFPFCEKNENLKLYNSKTIKEEIKNLEKLNFIKKTKQQKLRNWVFSRQRYWGEPFPIVFNESNEAFALIDLPVELPFMELNSEYNEEVNKPLDKLTNWVNVKFIELDNNYAKIIETEKEEIEYNGKIYKVSKGKRETNTMPNWAGSCWYYLRYIDNLNNEEIFSQENLNYWLKPKKTGSIDLYLGGAEHAVMHLLYARFWHFILYDLNIVNSPEPFQKLFNQGMILGPVYQNSEGKFFNYKEIEIINNEYYLKQTKEKLIQTIGKIGKRYKNGITPQEACSEHGIDSVRLYMMYLGPLEQNKPYNFNAINGMKRFLNNVQKLSIKKEKNEKLIFDFNEMLKKISEDLENLKFNTAISQLIIFTNKYKEMPKEIYRNFLIILNPLAPHLSEFLYQKNCKNLDSIQLENWPQTINNNYNNKETIIIIQINGKKKEEINFNENKNEKEIKDFVKSYIEKNQLNVKKEIIIKKEFYLINLVI